MLTDLILGTAGHIDHGKTSLTRALTGTNTDRLPEEKKRGITIELGYAHLDLPPFRLGIVDVPGHEKFVRQMLAGATGMDMAMLIVAGDDSIKQQTREHLDILRMLDLPAGVIALTKCDLVEPDWLEMVEDEIRQLVEGTFLETAPIIRTSAKDGTGIPELKTALSAACKIVSETDRQQRINAPFRMAIDRAFAIEGHGTVVTGSVSSGSVDVGDTLEVQPGKIQVRVRGLQNHDQSSEEVHRGQRAAIKLAGVHHSDIERGHELCAEGHLLPSELMSIKLHLLSSLRKPLKDRTRVRFHIGTAELFGNIRLLEGTELEPGQQTVAQVFLSEPAVAIWNQPFVVRRQSPLETIGGGRIIHPNASRIRKATEQQLDMLKLLADGNTIERASASAFFAEGLNWQPLELPRTAGVVDVAGTYAQLLEQSHVIETKLSATRTAIIHRGRFDELADRVLKSLARMHEQFPLRFVHPRLQLENEFAYLEQPELLSAILTELRTQKKIELNRDVIGLIGHGPKLSKGERALMEQLIVQLKGAGMAPPTMKELQATAKKNKDSVPELLEMASQGGQVAKVTKEFFFHGDVIEEAKATLAEEIKKGDGLTLSEIRQILDTSRKYAVPLCEYFDSIGFTVRDGDKRKLGALD